jgi:hypothetical protein
MKTPNDRKTLLVYRFGEGYALKPDGTPLYGWPYTIHYAPDNSSSEFCLAEGDGRNGSGGFFSASDLLEPQWRSHLEITQTLWLLPLLERRARNETVSAEEYREAYQQARGSLPVTEEWTLP